MSDIGLYGEELYEQVLPLHGPDPDGLARDLIGAYVHGALFIDELARDTDKGPGWGVILDVDDCPIVGLPWLAQIAGVTLRDPRLITVYNVALNPSFEGNSTTGFFGYNAVLDRALGGTDGDWMLRGTANANATTGVTLIANLTGQFDIAAAFDVISVQRPVQLELEFQNGSFTPIETLTGTLSSTAGRRSIVAKSPAGTEYVQMQALIPSSHIGEKFYFDAFLLSPNNQDPTFFDGASPGGSWVGGDPLFSTSALTRLETPEEWAVYARDAIRRQGGKNRGKPDAILSVAEDYLTGTRSARLIERVGGDAYALELITRPSETPDPDALLAALIGVAPNWNGIIPAGMKLTHTLTEGVVIDEGTRTIDSSTGTIDTATLGDVT